MKPDQIVSVLRQMADAIQNSKRPERKFVAADLQKLISSLEGEPAPAKEQPKPSQIASRLHQIAVGIEGSKNPDKKLVAADIEQVLAAVKS